LTQTPWTLEQAGRMRVTRVTKVAPETPIDVTLEFKDEAPVAPGQFYMLWVIGAEEVPMSASVVGAGGRRGATARNFGETTAKMRAMKTGDKLGVRGPFGNGFSMGWKKPLFVGGGAGMASIITAIDAWAARGRRPVVITGGRSASDVLFEKRLRKLKAEVHVTTDDGSKGYHGTAVARAAELMDAGPFSDVVTCGPERMLVALLKEARSRKVRVEAALERLMKCAMGVCDICSIDGLRVCRQGPVFDSKFLLASRQFGKVELNATGQLEPI
jgi:dihydroorotate dehydrogenase electron transfer subunit